MRSIVIYIFFLVGIHVSVLAQEILVKSFQKLGRDLEARTQPRLDLNDNPCSIIKVVTTGEDFQFEGNTIGDPVYRKGEVVVYMTEKAVVLPSNMRNMGSYVMSFHNQSGSKKYMSLW